jgi:23S rRNA G2445 N2-methylase RlmL
MNAPAAFALNALTHPQPHQTYVNLMAGSGTLLAERLALDLPGLYIASDIDTDALDCAARNLTGHPQARLMLMDATHTPLPDACADVICADLPFGQLVGSHAENLDLYPRFLQEAARIARPDARLGLLTHEINLMTRTLEAQSAWELEEERLISLRGLHPRILVLRREP